MEMRYKLTVSCVIIMLIFLFENNWLYIVYALNIDTYDIVDGYIQNENDENSVVSYSYEGTSTSIVVRKEKGDKAGKKVRLLVKNTNNFVQRFPNLIEWRVTLFLLVLIAISYALEWDRTYQQLTLRRKYTTILNTRVATKFAGYDEFKLEMPCCVILIAVVLLKPVTAPVFFAALVSYLIISTVFIVLSDQRIYKQEQIKEEKRTESIWAKIYSIEAVHNGRYYVIYCSYKQDNDLFSFVSKGVLYVIKNAYDLNVDVKEVYHKNEMLKEEMKNLRPTVQVDDLIEVKVEPGNYVNYYVVIDDLF